MSRRVLNDLQGVTTLAIVEGAQGGKLVVEGKIGQCDKATANGRIYPRSVVEREIRRLQPRIEQASLFSAVDHPSDGRTKLQDSGAIVRGLWVEPNGEIRGKFEVVEDAPAGQAIAAFMRAGAAVGMSSRGMGSTVSGPNGQDVVGEDYRLGTWDFVSDPACGDAYPALMSESEEAKVTEEYLRKRFPKLVQGIEEHAYSTVQCVVESDVLERVTKETQEQAAQAIEQATPEMRAQMKTEVRAECQAELREDFATKLVRALAEMRKDVAEEVRSEFAADPEVAGAKLALKKIAEMVSPFQPTPDVKKVLDEKDTAYKTLQSKLQGTESRLRTEQDRSAKLDSTGKQLAYAVYVEQRFSGRPDVAQLRTLVGDLSAIGTAEELKDKVAAVVAEADRHLAQVTEQAEESTAQAVAEIEAEAEARIDAANRQVKQAALREQAFRKEIAAKLGGFEAQLQETVARKDSEAAALRQQLQEALTRTNKLQEQVSTPDLVNYAQRRTLGHRQAKAIVEQTSLGNLTTRAAIDRAATKLEESAVEPGGVHERLRRTFAFGREVFTEDERKAHERREIQEHYTGDSNHGEAADDLRALGTSLQEQIGLSNGPKRISNF